jgi:general stress protein 26
MTWANPDYTIGFQPQAIGTAGLDALFVVHAASREKVRRVRLPDYSLPITVLQSSAMPRKAVAKKQSAGQTMPTPTRPRMPAGYSGKGKPKFLPWTWVTERLERSHNYWICSTRSDGRPHAMPVWGIYVDNAVVFSTAPSTLKAKNMKRNPAIIVHLESGDELVVLEGNVEMIKLNKPIDDAYNAKYKMRLSSFPGPAAIYALKPKVVLAWREKDFPTSATRWQFD